MTKEELIALSDLNREDNIKYISSEAQGIAITLDSDRYAPNLCKLERAYICGRRKSEEQIEQLEKENAELKKACDETQELLDKQIEATLKLDKENAELTRINDNLEKDRLAHIELEDKLKKENSELRNNGFTVSAMTEQQLKVALEKGEQLEKENAELSEKLSEQKQYTAFKCNEFVKKKEVYEREHFLLNKAKEIIKYLCGMVRELNNPNVQLTNVDYSLSEAEQFINSEVEK